LDDQSLIDTRTLKSVYRYIFKLAATVFVGAIVVYLPSYSVLSSFQNIYTEERVLKASLDSIIFEDGEGLGQERIESFRKTCETRRGVLFCVINSEFAEEATAILIVMLLIIIGVPYSRFLSELPPVEEKKAFKKAMELLDYKEMRAVNQTFERLMTRSNAWGAVVFLGERFARNTLKEYMIPCILNSLQEHTSDRNLLERLKDFNQRNSTQI
jgi:Rad3-related DNA helicase